MKNKLILFLKGGLIGMALAIPGVSAGTMALITGLYTPIIHILSSITISSLTRKTLTALWRSYSDLVYVFIGSFVGLYLAVQWMVFFVKTYPLQMYSLFSGIILASIPFLYQQMKRNKMGLGVFLISAVFTFGLSFFQSFFFQGYFWIFLFHLSCCRSHAVAWSFRFLYSYYYGNLFPCFGRCTEFFMENVFLHYHWSFKFNHCF